MKVNVTMVYQMTVKSDGTMSHLSILKRNIKRIIIVIFFLDANFNMLLSSTQLTTAALIKMVTLSKG